MNCPQCGAEPEKMTQAVNDGTILYGCANGHHWTTDEPKTDTANTGRTEEEPERRWEDHVDEYGYG